MDKITFEEIEYLGITTTFVVITHQDGSVTSMSKETYDAQIAAQNTLASESAKELTESLPDDPLATADSVSPSPIVP